MHEGDEMKIGVISDTHDQQDLILECVHRLNEADVELVVHCGDWVSPSKYITGLQLVIDGGMMSASGPPLRPN